MRSIVGNRIGKMQVAKFFSSLLAVSAVITFSTQLSFAQSLEDVTEETCVRGDCIDGEGSLELETAFGKGKFIGNFLDGEFNGRGRLEIPISFIEKEIYVGNWQRGVRGGRGTHWNGKGKLYIGEWRDNKRNGRGSYFFGLPEWRENEHTEFWLSQNVENYTGDFVNDHYQGQGVYRWPGGQKFEGGFFASNKHGPGVFYYVTGTRREQLWNYGDFVR